MHEHYARLQRGQGPGAVNHNQGGKHGNRGGGICKALLGAVETCAREDGCRKLYLDTRITLEPAVSLYRAFGFQIIFQQGLYIQMEKRLQVWVGMKKEAR